MVVKNGSIVGPETSSSRKSVDSEDSWHSPSIASPSQMPIASPSEMIGPICPPQRSQGTTPSQEITRIGSSPGTTPSQHITRIGSSPGTTPSQQITSFHRTSSLHRMGSVNGSPLGSGSSERTSTIFTRAEATNAIRYSQRQYRFHFGPNNIGEETFNFSRKIKRRYIEELVHATSQMKTSEVVNLCVQQLKTIQPDLRSWYGGNIMNMDIIKFLELITLDCLFIIQLFMKNSELVGRDVNDPILSSLKERSHVLGDLLMLDNQVPLKALKCLSEMSIIKNLLKDITIEELAVYFFKRVLPDDEFTNTIPVSSDQEYCFILGGRPYS